MRNIVILATLLGVASCASVPNVESTLDAPVHGRVQIMGTRGALTVRQSTDLLKRKGITGAEFDVLARHLALEEMVAETRLTAGNKIQVLRDGTDTFRAMFDAIRGAKKHINFEYYIFEDVQSDGESLGDLLLKKQAAGVAVNIIYDSYGSDSTPSAFFNRLRDGGIQMVSYNSVNPLHAKGGYKPNDRDHRKILVADGELGIVGGVNLSTDYQSSRLGKSGSPGKKPIEGPATQSTESGAAKRPDYWRDTDLKIDGPVVAQLQHLFVDHWTQQKGPPLDQGDFFPAVPAKGTEVARIIGSTPQKGQPRYYVTLLSSIRAAEKTILVNAAYFVPTDQEKEDLMNAARRGVDVRLLLPGRSDSKMSLSVQHSQYADMFKAGITIYETQQEILHSKTVVVDGVWSVVGSSNLDHRSVLFNDEVDAVVLGKDTALALQHAFDDDVKQAVKVDPDLWHHRPLTAKVNDTLSRVWQHLL